MFASSQEGLTPGDTTSVTQFFEYNAATGELVRVTQGEDGYNDNGTSVTAGVNPNSIANIASEFGHKWRRCQIDDESLECVCGWENGCFLDGGSVEWVGDGGEWGLF